MQLNRSATHLKPDFAFGSFRNRCSFPSNRSARAFVFVAGSAPQPWVSRLGHFERNPAKVERLASDVIELSTRNQFAVWLAGGKVLRGWARSVSGDTAEGLAWIEDGIDNWRATGDILALPYYLALKAEALYLTHRTSEALEAIRDAKDVKNAGGVPNCTGFAVCFLRPLVRTRLKLRLRSVKP